MKKLVIVCIALLCAGCSSNIRYYPYLFKQEPARNIKTVAVAPMNLIFRLPPQAGDRSKVVLVYDVLKAYLAENRIAVQPAEKITAIWEEEKRKIGGIFDPGNGRLLQDKLNTCLMNTVSRVCTAQSADALIFPEITMRPALLESSFAYWDGIQQNIDLGRGSEQPSYDRISGNLPAISLRVVVVYKNGQVVSRNIGGLEFPYKAVLDKKNGIDTKMELRKDLFMDEVRIRRAVALSLHPFIVYPEYPATPSFLKN